MPTRMTRQHFNAIAEALAETRNDQWGDTDRTNAVDMVARSLAARLGRFNSGFDRERFLEACGVEEH